MNVDRQIYVVTSALVLTILVGIVGIRTGALQRMHVSCVMFFPIVVGFVLTSAYLFHVSQRATSRLAAFVAKTPLFLVVAAILYLYFSIWRLY